MVTKSPLGVPLDVAVAAFLADCRRRNLSPRTLECYRDTLRDLTRTLPPAPDLAWLDLQAGRAWLDARASRSPGTRALYVRVVRRFASWCAGEYEGYDFPFARLVQPQVPELASRALAPDKIRHLLASNEEPVVYALTFLLETGLRVSEAIAVRVDDLDHEGVLVRDPKGLHERVVPISRPLARATKVYLARTRPAFALEGGPDLLLISSRGHTYSRRTLLRTVMYAGERAGITGLGPHDLRRQFAHDLGEAGVSIFVIAALLGHRTLTSVSRYAKPAQRDAVAAMGRTSPLSEAWRDRV